MAFSRPLGGSPFDRARASLVLGGEAFVESVKRRIRNADHWDAGRVLRALARLHPRTDLAGTRRYLMRRFPFFVVYRQGEE